jgi:putative glycosyltransferase (TIGR04372 family)
MSGSDILWRPDIHSIKFDIYKSEKKDWGNQHKNYLDIEITQQSTERCNKIFQSLGYRNRDFICIHVREGGYKGDHLSNLLNVNIRNFIKAIKEICGRGFLVFRLGDSSMTKLPKIKNLIDYPFTNYKSTEMDNFLIKNCKFFICGPSGPLDSGRFIHKKRMLFHNSYNFFDLPFNPGDIALMRPFYSKSKQRFLSIEEICLSYKKIKNSWWMCKDWIMEENNEDEILDAVKEMLYNNFLLASPLQKQFKKYQSRAAKYLLKNLRFQENDLDNTIDQYRFASRSLHWRGTISESFLKKNWQKSSRNK